MLTLLAVMVQEREMRLEPPYFQHHCISHDGVDTSNIEKFKRLNLPAFNKGFDPLLAEYWIKETEKLFGSGILESLSRETISGGICRKVHRLETLRP